ncbi:hypothetical protein BDN72DRAFT_807271 [Pluteus cervinus]|uniref:Uncharacterized protein n=1 Tax=Pluteus cervinus TaxID=181527 RepID=A0ACD3BGM4_9AGAR|nr:hypothetical protein BDN72DRAFT_807271 [Pluteus cervinus]
MAWTLAQIEPHSTPSSCWVIIQNHVYDVTEFLAEHPGGAAIILKYAGRDATQVYEPIHPKDTLQKHLPSSKHLGPLDVTATSTLAQARDSQQKTKDELRVEAAKGNRPPLSRILSLADLEAVAKATIPHKAWSYYSSASDDEISFRENERAFSRFFFRARVLRAVSWCDPSTTILGYKSSLPVFVSGAALAKLAHPLGELNITRASGAASIIQMVSSNSSFSAPEIAAAALPSQVLFFQLYKHRNDAIAAQRVRDIENLGYKAIFLTVDAVVPSNRERDIRSPWELEDIETGVPPVYEEGPEAQDGSGLGTAGALIMNDDRDMTWEKTIPWLRSVTRLPIVLKGVQCVEDALLAAQAGVDGILLSNHGGRQLEYALPPMEVLYRLRKDHPEVFSKLEVYLDGGVRRGTDIIKALCLGAKAVGLGRPFLYAQGAYGEAGVTKLIRILEREMTTGMRLLGASTTHDLTPDLVERVDWQPQLRSKL